MNPTVKKVLIIGVIITVAYFVYQKTKKTVEVDVVEEKSSACGCGA